MKTLKEFKENKLELDNMKSVTGGYDSYSLVWNKPGGASTEGNWVEFSTID